jgi:hypothetical protein
MTEHGRFYYHPGRGHDGKPSITNIIGKKFKPLFGAGMKEAANYAADNIATLATLEREQIFQLCTHTPRRPDSPSAIGDIVHGMIERYVKGDAPTHDEVMGSHQTVKWMWGQFLKFQEYYKPEYTGSEFTVWSDKYGYAGTADLGFRIGGAHVLCDAKTGKATYPEVAMQLAAIQYADFIITPDGRELPIPQYDRYAVLHIRPRSATLKPVFKIPEAFEAFLALKKVFDWDVFHANEAIGFAPKVN